MKFLKSVAMLVLAAILLSTAVFAESAVHPYLNGMKVFEVTSSMSSEDNIKTSNFFDGNIKTSCTVSLLDSDTSVFSLYTASRTPEAVTAFAAALSGKDVHISVSLYATNDYLFTSWDRIALKSEVNVRDGYHIFKVDGKIERYSFYRIDFNVTEGHEFVLSELLMYKSENDPDYIYAQTDVLLPGESPELIEIIPEEPLVEEKARPIFGNGFLFFATGLNFAPVMPK